jgi:hypothetical protein
MSFSEEAVSNKDSILVNSSCEKPGIVLTPIDKTGIA